MSSAWGKNHKEEVKKNSKKRLTKFEREKIKATFQHAVLRCKRQIVRPECTDVIVCRFNVVIIIAVVQLWGEHGCKVIRVKSKKGSKNKSKNKSKSKSKNKSKNKSKSKSKNK